MRPFQDDGPDAERKRLTGLHEQTVYLQGIADELNARVAEIKDCSEPEELERLEQELSSGPHAASLTVGRSPSSGKG